MTRDEAFIHIWIAYRAHMEEHTGEPFAKIEQWAEADRAFWRARPEAEALVKGSRDEED